MSKSDPDSRDSSASPASPPFLPFAPEPDRDSQPYWDALARNEFKLQRCADCAALRWPARALCNRCRSFEYAWEETDGSGHIVSWVRTHQVFAPALAQAVPYCVIQVALEAQDDLLLIGGWLSNRSPRAGERVEMRILEGTDGFHFPCWQPVSTARAQSK